MILGLVKDSVAQGADQGEACDVIGVDARTLQRWRKRGGGDDRRAGPNQVPHNKLSAKEYERLRTTVTSPEFRDLSPHQIVPRLADQGTYVGSEATIFRMLHREKMLQHRESSRAPTKRHRPRAQRATGPRQVWSWDITYLKSPIRGRFFYLYLVLDVWSRKIVGWMIEEAETAEHAARLMAATCQAEHIIPGLLVIHADNGGPMKGSTMLATLQALGVATSFSRPSVSNDNPFSESLFRTLKYRPVFPDAPFASLEAAREWMAAFVHWYNTEHRHSAIRYVTPEQRHTGREEALLKARNVVYAKARRAQPERWSRGTRNWTPIAEVLLNPTPLDEQNKVA